jgi:putative hydrolase of the HAD superfamily
MSTIVFDAGGTLMEFVGMPLSWIDYYYQGFFHIAQQINKEISCEEIEKSVYIMKKFNPRIQYREIEYSPEYIFKRALQHWDIDYFISSAIEDFFNGINLSVKIYPDSIPVLKNLKAQGHNIALFTDLPSAMPDRLFKENIVNLLPHLDYYVSSQTCGYRKPNIKGLQEIATHFDTPIKQLIFIGDEEKDQILAQNAGCQFIQILRHSSPKTNCIPNLYNLCNLI